MQKVTVRKDIEAWQWSGEEKDLPEGFHCCQPEVHYSAGRKYIYFTYADFRPRNWMGMERLAEKPSDPEVLAFGGGAEITLKDGRKYWREILPFAYYSVKAESSITRDNSAKFLDRSNKDEVDAFLDYANGEGWENTKDGVFSLPPRIEYRVVDGAYGRGYRPYYMKKTDWLVKDGAVIKVVSDADFKLMSSAPAA